jgi:membrane-bound metal-dependent hydrolase YbcI (DUF457 family)
MLIGAAAAEAVTIGSPLPRYRAWAVGAIFGLLPDLDFGIRLLTGEFAPIERSILHSLPATALITLVVWLVADRRWAAVAGTAYASHLVADLLQDQARSSVALLWPLQQRGMETVLPLFPFVPVHRGEGVMGAAISLFHGASLAPFIQNTAIGAGIFFAVLWVSCTLRRRRIRPKRAGAP